MKRMTNAIVSVATALAMVVATCPASALAEELGVNDAQVDAAVVGETDDDAVDETDDDAVDETDAAADPGAAPLAIVDLDAYDDFTLETWADQIDLATADGDTVSTAAAAAKQKVLAAWASCATSVTFSTADGITVADVRAAMALAFADPEYYWASSSYSLSYYDNDGDGSASDTDIASTLKLAYVVDTANIAAVKSATEAKVAEALTWVDSDNMTDFQVAQALHDYLVRNCVYDSAATSATTPTTSFTAYGALVNGSAVCQGYALAYKLLLSRAGVPCVFVVSNDMGHAWNMVQVGGDWYHVDVTWDDPVYPNGTDAGFDVDVSHDYFLRADSTMTASLNHYGWEAAYTTPTADYANRTYGEYKAPVSTTSGSGESGSGFDSGSTSSVEKTYAHSDTKTQGSITLTVQWDDPVLGEPTTFHVSATGGSGSYKYYMTAPMYSSPNESSYQSVADPSRTQYWHYTEDVCESYDYTFTMTATGTYYINFYVMDTGASPNVTVRTNTFITVSDANYPSVSSIVNDAVAKAKSNTDGSDYAMALYLHDWLLDQLEYDKSLKWSGAEAALTRHAGTCQAYTYAYIKLLNAAGIENTETRDTYDGHTWNAVKLDGEWYQVDCTWDDNDDTKYYGFDARHLYFAITDELMAVAHKGHAKIYTADGYATRSTSLADNYYVKSGLASTWADAYAARIQAKLDAKETSFSISSDNAINPPSIIGIQNAVVAYAMNQKEWTAADGATAALTATSTVTTESSTKWTAVYDFTVEYGTVATSIAGATVTASDQVFTGSALTPTVTVKLGEKTLTAGADYDVSYSGNVNAGTATVTVTGKGDYAGTATGTFKIAAADASKATVKVADATYTGAALTPATTVTLGNKTLVKGTDYTVAYSGNTNVGTATATVTFKGNYSGTAKGTFKIAAASVASASVSVAAQTYSGAALTPAVTVKVGNKTLVKGTDYDVAYSNNVNAGTATVTITGKGNYTGSKASTFTIAAADASKAAVAVAAQTYTGSALTPAPTVTFNNKTLVKGTDYTVSYANNTNAGTATATVTFKGNYSGTAKGTFAIKAADASKASVSVAAQTYTGAALTPAPTVTFNNKTLVNGTDYTVAYANNTAAGTATATVSFKGNYSGAAKGTFAIKAADASKAAVALADQAWTGSALTPAPTVTLNGKTLKQGTDYTVAYTGNINVGTATATVTFKGNYSGTAKGTFRIAAALLSGAAVTAADQTYTGGALTPAVTVKVGEKTLVNGADYTVAYANNTNAGTATVTVTGKGNYAGTATGTFKVKAADASKAGVAVASQTYTGAALTPAPTVTFNGKTLKSGADYTVAYSNNTNAGTATATVTFKGNYSGTAKGSFKISPAQVSGASVSVARQTYTGSALTPGVTVKLGEKTLVKGTDYTVSYSNNTNAGTANVTVAGKGNYAGAKASTFAISAADASKASVSLSAQTYTGSALTPAPAVTFNGKTLAKGSDYTVTYSSNTNAGTATATVTFKGNYSGTAKGTFAIKAADASKASVSVAAQTYTGAALTPAPTVAFNGKTLVKGTDYTVAYSNNTNAGIATATVTFKGNYSGTAEANFSIKAADASKASVSVAAQTYTSAALAPAPTVTFNNKTLVKGTDYTVAYSNNTNAGTATATVTFKGNYSGTAKGSFKISPAQVSGASVSVARQTYTGSALTPGVTVKLGEKTLVKGTDYTVSYSNNTNAGTANVTVAGKGNYAGTKASTFTISSADASKASVSLSAQTYTGSALTPAPTVTLDGKTLKPGTDYTVAYASNTNAGTATAMVTFKGNYSGAAKGTFAIKAADTSKASVAVASQTYTGAALAPAPTVTLNGKTLKSGTDYTVSYANNTNAGTATATVTFKGNYSGTAKGTFAIKAADASKATVKLADQSFSAKALTPAPTVTLNGKTLKQGTDFSVAYSNNKNPGTATATVTFKGNYSGTAKGTFKITSASVVYQAHVQNIGWQAAVKDGAVAGTSGRSLRVEALKVSVTGAGCDGQIQIRAHVQDIGWQNWSTLGGTYGQSKRVEAMQLRLTGELANRYDVYYRVHAQNYGWMGWAKNGEQAGTEGMSLRLEAIQVKLVPKGGAAPGSTANAFRKPAATVEYQAHVQNIGWQATVSGGATAGTSGQSLRVEALRVSLAHADYAGGVQIRAHVQNIGWQGWSTTGGTSGQSLRVEAMQIRLTGEMANHYDVYYRVHAQNIGWMGWAKNGEQAGTAGYSYRLEAIQIKLVPKGSAAPGSTANRFQSR